MTRNKQRPKHTGELKKMPSASTEDYLERIQELLDRTGNARVVDIAAALHVSRPSVTAKVQKLAAAGYLHYERYRGLLMTDKGMRLASEIKNRHLVLQRFFSLLGLDNQTAEEDIEGLEHSLSAETLCRLETLSDFLTEHDGAFAAFRSRARPEKRRK